MTQSSIPVITPFKAITLSPLALFPHKGGGDSGVYRVSGGKSGGSEEEAQRHPRLA